MTKFIFVVVALFAVAAATPLNIDENDKIPEDVKYYKGYPITSDGEATDGIGAKPVKYYKGYPITSDGDATDGIGAPVKYYKGYPITG